MPSYGADLLAQKRTIHGFSLHMNPYCKTCSLRTYPDWGEHTCRGDDNAEVIRRSRHAAGDILANLHFYRLEAVEQIAALTEALAYTLARNVHPNRLQTKLTFLLPKLNRMTKQAASGPVETVVADVSKKKHLLAKKAATPKTPTPTKTLKAKVSHGRPAKADRPHRQTVSAGRRRPQR